MKAEAKVIAKDLPISWKQSVELCDFVRNNPLSKAKTKLQNVISMKAPAPYKKYVQSMPHRRGNMATGRYPIKAATHLLHVLNSAEANAEVKGLDVKNLIITKLIANKAGNQPHYGRNRRNMKRTHIA